MVKILWVSRHEPLREQVEELEQVFGDVEITRYCDIVYSGAQLAQVNKVCVDELKGRVPRLRRDDFVKWGYVVEGSRVRRK